MMRSDITKAETRLFLGDCCHTMACQRAWAVGAPCCYPYSWRETEKGIVARYYCLRCSSSWNCWWSSYVVTSGHDEITSQSAIETRCQDQDNLGLKLCESEIEKRFWSVAEDFIMGLTPQVKVGHYRADFAVPRLRLAIEVDGKEAHASPEQQERDCVRDQDFLAHGWRVLRFTGSEIFRDVAACILEILTIIGSRYAIGQAQISREQQDLAWLGRRDEAEREGQEFGEEQPC